jgi:hypothetical protein
MTMLIGPQVASAPSPSIAVASFEGNLIDGRIKSSLINRLAQLKTRAQPLATHLTSRRSGMCIYGSTGIYVQARLGDDEQCLLAIIWATPQGKKEFVGLIDGVRESAQSWKELLLDLKRRGLAMGSELAIADGALGFWQAIEEVRPNTRGPRWSK